MESIAKLTAQFKGIVKPHIQHMDLVLRIEVGEL